MLARKESTGSECSSIDREHLRRVSDRSEWTADPNPYPSMRIPRTLLALGAIHEIDSNSDIVSNSDSLCSDNSIADFGGLAATHSVVVPPRLESKCVSEPMKSTRTSLPDVPWAKVESPEHSQSRSKGSFSSERVGAACYRLSESEVLEMRKKSNQQTASGQGLGVLQTMLRKTHLFRSKYTSESEDSALPSRPVKDGQRKLFSLGFKGSATAEMDESSNASTDTLVDTNEGNNLSTSGQATIGSTPQQNSQWISQTRVEVPKKNLQQLLKSFFPSKHNRKWVHSNTNANSQTLSNYTRSSSLSSFLLKKNSNDSFIKPNRQSLFSVKSYSAENLRNNSESYHFHEPGNATDASPSFEIIPQSLKQHPSQEDTAKRNSIAMSLTSEEDVISVSAPPPSLCLRDTDAVGDVEQFTPAPLDDPPLPIQTTDTDFSYEKDSWMASQAPIDDPPSPITPAPLDDPPTPLGSPKSDYWYPELIGDLNALRFPGSASLEVNRGTPFTDSRVMIELNTSILSESVKNSGKEQLCEETPSVIEVSVELAKLYYDVCLSELGVSEIAMRVESGEYI